MKILLDDAVEREAELQVLSDAAVDAVARVQYAVICDEMRAPELADESWRAFAKKGESQLKAKITRMKKGGFSDTEIDTATGDAAAQGRKKAWEHFVAAQERSGRSLD